MELGKRARLALGVGASGALIAPLVAAVATKWVLSVALLAAALSGMVLLAVAVLWRALARAHDQVRVEAEARHQQHSEVLREVKELNAQLRTRCDQLTSQLESLSLRVAFPALHESADGEYAVSTRFADYLKSPVLRRSDRVEALLETLAKDAVERSAMERTILERLDVLDEARAGRG